ncbi:hypothetical protein GGE60_005699 [Rhizobium leucaenae]|uniref:Uncharacterized protein n=1 Tax=Rhizobium leucaenae TaxID=29450 RepID=A0A7W6ZZ96_9HYPH|nr:hypothetical protein [Rhizobium leucaenae]
MWESRKERSLRCLFHFAEVVQQPSSECHRDHNNANQ